MDQGVTNGRTQGGFNGAGTALSLRFVTSTQFYGDEPSPPRVGRSMYLGPVPKLISIYPRKQCIFPKATTRAVAPSAVGQNEELRRIGITLAPFLAPPQAKGIYGEEWRVV